MLIQCLAVWTNIRRSLQKSSGIFSRYLKRRREEERIQMDESYDTIMVSVVVRVERRVIWLPLHLCIVTLCNVSTLSRHKKI